MTLQNKSVPLLVCHFCKQLLWSLQHNEQMITEQNQVSILCCKHLSYDSNRASFYYLETSECIILIEIAGENVALPRACCAWWSIFNKMSLLYIWRFFCFFSQVWAPYGMMYFVWSRQFTKPRLAGCSSLTLAMHLLVLLNTKHELAFVWGGSFPWLRVLK